MDDTLYGSGKGSNPVMDRLSKDNSGNSGLQSSATSPPKPAGTSEGKPNAPEAQDYATDTQQSAGARQALTSNEGSRQEASQADANLLATREADRFSNEQKTTGYSTNQDSGSLRPEYPTAASAGSTASIKSNVIGRVPTGSALLQQQGDLPPVPATGGKFMGDETSSTEGAGSRKKLSGSYVNSRS